MTKYYPDGITPIMTIDELRAIKISFGKKNGRFIATDELLGFAIGKKTLGGAIQAIQMKLLGKSEITQVEALRLRSLTLEELLKIKAYRIAKFKQ